MFKRLHPYLHTITLCIACFTAGVRAQSIEKNDYVRYEVTAGTDRYEIRYRFKDPFDNFQTYTLSFPREATDRMTGKFGIPRWLFEPYADNAANRAERGAEISRGMFMLRGNVIEVDKSTVVAYYGEWFARPIAEMIVNSLAEYGKDTRGNRIEFAMRFIQDIPYGVPPYQDNERHYGGVHIPPQLLIQGYGDCDSKVLLFVGILSYLIPVDDIIFLNQQDHVLSAIKGSPGEGLTFVRYLDKEFLVAETSGPGKRMLGQKGSYFRKKFRVEPLTIEQPDIIPPEENTSPGQYTMDKDGIDANMLVLKNESETGVQFQISPDKRNWKTMTLKAYETGRYIYNQQTDLFIRLRTDRNEMLTYRVGTGKAYLFFWNNRKKVWEISTS